MIMVIRCDRCMEMLRPSSFIVWAKINDCLSGNHAVDSHIRVNAERWILVQYQPLSFSPFFHVILQAKNKNADAVHLDRAVSKVAASSFVFTYCEQDKKQTTTRANHLLCLKPLSTWNCSMIDDILLGDIKSA